MGRVNIIVDIKDPQIKEIIKKSRSERRLTELFNSLFTGYLVDDYIKAYVDGTRERIDEHTKQGLLDQIKGMRKTAADLDILSGELDNTVSYGRSRMMSAIEKETEEAGNIELKDKQVQIDENNKQIEEIHSEIDEIKNMQSSLQLAMMGVVKEVKAMIKTVESNSSNVNSDRKSDAGDVESLKSLEELGIDSDEDNSLLDGIPFVEEESNEDEQEEVSIDDLGGMFAAFGETNIW